MANKYEKVGGGSFGIYRRKPDVAGVIGGIVVVLLILGAIGSCAT